MLNGGVPCVHCRHSLHGGVNVRRYAVGEQGLSRGSQALRLCSCRVRNGITIATLERTGRISGWVATRSQDQRSLGQQEHVLPVVSRAPLLIRQNGEVLSNCVAEKRAEGPQIETPAVTHAEDGSWTELIGNSEAWC